MYFIMYFNLSISKTNTYYYVFIKIIPIELCSTILKTSNLRLTLLKTLEIR